MRRSRATKRLSYPIAAAAAIAMVGLLARDRARARTLEREVARRLPVGRNGIVIGAEPETLLGSRTHAVLVVHGFGDTPQSVRELAHYLHASGFTVELPLLPGHGRTLAEFGLSRAHDWIGYVRDQVARLRRTYTHVSLVGLSMGAALCAIVAAERDDIDALVMLSPYLNMPRHVRRVSRLLKISGPLAPFRKSAGRRVSILNPAAQPASLGLGVVSGRLLAELYDVTVVAQESLPHIEVPTLYMASMQDSRVPPDDALAGWQAIHASQRAFHWMEHSGHIMTVDYEKDAVFRDVAAWLDRFR